MSLSLRKSVVVSYIGLAFAVVILYGPALSYPFLGWDDQFIPLNADNLTFSFANLIHWWKTPCVGCYIPVAMYSFMLDKLFWGLNSFGFHLQNILWHIVAVWGFFWCCRFFGVRPGFAFVFSLIFAVHPQRVESVVWISERKDVMCAAFYIWSCAAYFAVSQDRKFPLLSFVLFILSLLSKPMGISLPMALLIFEIWRTRSFELWSPLKKLWPFFLFAFLLTLVTFFTQEIGGGNLRLWWQIPIAGYNVFWYLWMTFFPVDLCPIYPKIIVDGVFLTGVLFLWLILGIFPIFLEKRVKKRFFWGVCAVFITYLIILAPISGLVSIGAMHHADRYSYLPSAVVWLGLAVGTRRFWALIHIDKRLASFYRPFIIAGFATYILFLCGTTMLYLPSWSDDFIFLKSAVERPKANGVALWRLAQLYLDKSDYERAYELANRLSDERFPADDKPYHEIRSAYLKAMILAKTGRHAAAVELFHQILSNPSSQVFAIGTTNANLLSELAKCHLSLGEKSDAVWLYRQLADSFGNDTYEYYFYNGLAAFIQEDYKEALDSFEQAVKLKPEDELAARNAALSREKIGLSIKTMKGSETR